MLIWLQKAYKYPTSMQAQMPMVWLKFTYQVGFPVLLIDNIYRTLAQCGVMIGFIPKNAPIDNLEALKFAYQHIFDVCKKNGAEIVVLNLGGFSNGSDAFESHWDRTHFQKNIEKPAITFQISS